MTIKKRQRAARKREAACTVWIIRDMRANHIEIASGMAFPTEAIAQSYCRLTSDKPFELHLIRKARRQALTPNAEGCFRPEAQRRDVK